ncbi:MAG: prephenate dehydrogenase/arogenate dehydrogenase family protein [Chloroflexota bacterium]
MRISFLGLGLIGGSIAGALRDGASGGIPVIAAWTPGGSGPREALAAGIIDHAAASPEEAVAGADLVVLAAPPLACVELIVRLGGLWAGSLEPGATVTDVASTKAAVTAAARAAGIPFAGGHPMAGRETSGFGAADPALFRDRPWVLTEAVGGGDREAVRRLALACGARPVDLGSERHDRLVASISHVPLLTSVALVEAVAGWGPDPAADWPDAAALAATGWRDTTRLARGDTTMGAEIAASNAVAIVEVLRAYRERIDALIAALDDPQGPDIAALRERLDVARDRLEGRR